MVEEPLRNSVSFEPGSSFAGYTIRSKIKSGGMATLYRAERTGVKGFTRDVALKVIHPHLAERPELVQMFVDEAMLGSRLEHPHIARIEEFGEVQGHFFLVMEHIDGCSLADLSRHLRKSDTCVDPTIAVSIAISVAEALHAAHEAVDDHGNPLRVIHRDVTPGNILLSKKGHVKMIDFGIASSELRRDHTKDSLKGKIRYMSPEQARGKKLTPSSDVYSLALVLWELLAGRRAFDGGRDLALLDRVRAPDLSPPSAYSDAVNAELDAVVMRALSPEPPARYVSGEEFARALRDVEPEAIVPNRGHIGKLAHTISRKRRIEQASHSSASVSRSFSGSVVSRSSVKVTQTAEVSDMGATQRPGARSASRIAPDVDEDIPGVVRAPSVPHVRDSDQPTKVPTIRQAVQEPKPIGKYIALAAVVVALAIGFGWAAARSTYALPEEVARPALLPAEESEGEVERPEAPIPEDSPPVREVTAESQGIAPAVDTPPEPVDEPEVAEVETAEVIEVSMEPTASMRRRRPPRRGRTMGSGMTASADVRPDGRRDTAMSATTTRVGGTLLATEPAASTAMTSETRIGGTLFAE